MTRCGWQPGCEFRRGSFVKHGGHYYRAQQPHRAHHGMEPEKDSNAWVRVPKDEYKEWKRHQKDQGGQGQGQPIPGVPPAEGGAAQTTPQEQPQTEVKQQEQPQTQPEQQQAPTGGYGGQQQPAEAAPTESDDPRKQKKEGIDIGKLHISDDALKVGGGILGTAAAVGLGAFGWDKYQDSKEKKAETEWGYNNWEQDARLRQGEYLEAIQQNKPLPPVTWVLTDSNNIPAGAIKGGHEADGTPLYITRTFHENSVQIGKMSPNMKEGCHISYGGKEVSKQTYEILLGYENAIKWVDAQGECKVDEQGLKPVEGGREADGRPLWVAQAPVKESVVPGKCGKHLDGARVPYGNDEKEVKNYRVMVYP